MSIQESYPTTSPRSNIFLFNSIGTKGEIPKVILYEFIEKNRYNLAFGDLVKGRMDDEVVSNNNDLAKVISTVATTIYKFTDRNPEAVIEIRGVDNKRTQLYNSLFKRKINEIDEYFFVWGITVEEGKELYRPNRFYDEFEIQRKK